MAAKPRLCILDTHFFPLSNLPWHKRVIHWYVHILVLSINLPYSCMWWQLPRSPGLFSLSFPLMLSAQRSWPACFSLKPPFLDEEWLGVRGRGPEEEKWEKDHLRQNVTLRSRIGGFNHSLVYKYTSQPPPSEVRPALPCLGLPGSQRKAGLGWQWPWAWGGAWFMVKLVFGLISSINTTFSSSWPNKCMLLGDFQPFATLIIHQLDLHKQLSLLGPARAHSQFRSLGMRKIILFVS